MPDEQHAHVGARSDLDIQPNWHDAGGARKIETLYAANQRGQRTQCINLAPFKAIDDYLLYFEASSNIDEPSPSVCVGRVAWPSPL